MRRILFLFALSFIVLHINAQSEKICRTGFAFEISNNPNWGNGEPVIINITPGSPAERAGLKLNDIILEVNQQGTYLKPHHTIKAWMLDNNQSDIEISIRNLETDFRTIKIDKDCRSRVGIDESKLAPVFAFYSLEDVQNRTFHIPMKITTNTESILSDYRTFDFAPVDAGTPEIDNKISAVFEKVLTQRGLKRDKEDPDFIIQTFYSYENNPAYNPITTVKTEDKANWRFDINNNKMVKLPLYSPTDVVDNEKVPYFLEFGFRFYDRKFIEPGKMIQIWECEVRERVKSNYGLESYLEINLPLILLKYPYPGNMNLGTYEVNFLQYNYTGLNYNIENLSKVEFVDSNSPAALAGIKKGDIIKNIQGVKLSNNLKNLTDSYRGFINETMNLRNPGTRYTDTNGYKDCMFWEVGEYNKVAKTLNKKSYQTAFTYLFNFNQYIDWETPNTITIEVDRNKESLDFQFTPEVYKSAQISAF
ncbi:MAG: PDZ domain-containing protein [Dysgonamonadaceae bacterium]|nr:PDZ domain-containing protein [Dysgonamonadaceae bacterium]MDD4728773.1 PDZ domain-containing protein [Dysgonamonadaceae bacterium]